MGKRGPAPWKPSEAERRLVEHYTAIGYTQAQIGALMDKSIDSLQRHCRKELDNGGLTVNAKVAGKLYQEAMAGNVSALIFWAKTRMGWKETDRHEHTGANGGPIAAAITDADTFTRAVTSLASREGEGGSPSGTKH